jgi:hypothetical protein
MVVVLRLSKSDYSQVQINEDDLAFDRKKGRSNEQYLLPRSPESASQIWTVRSAGGTEATRARVRGPFRFAEALKLRQSFTTNCESSELEQQKRTGHKEKRKGGERGRVAAITP